MAKLSIHEWFSKRKQERSEEYRSERLDIPGNLWIKCYKCSATIFSKDLNSNYKVCPKCNYHFRLSSAERIAMLLDPGSFKELDPEMISTDFLASGPSIRGERPCSRASMSSSYWRR